MSSRYLLFTICFGRKGVDAEVDDQANPLGAASEPGDAGLTLLLREGSPAPIAVGRPEVDALPIGLAVAPAQPGRRIVRRLVESQVAGDEVREGRLPFQFLRPDANTVRVDEKSADPVASHLLGERLEGLRLGR